MWAELCLYLIVDSLFDNHMLELCALFVPILTEKMCVFLSFIPEYFRNLQKIRLCVDTLSTILWPFTAYPGCDRGLVQTNKNML